METIWKNAGFSRTIVFSLIFMLLVSFSFVPIANAAGTTSREIMMEKELEIFFNEVVYIDENGVEQIDFAQMEKYFGKEQTETVKAMGASAEQANQCDQSVEAMAGGTFSSCMKDALLDYLGVSAVQAMLTGGVWHYLEKKAWKEAAKLAVKIGVGTNAVTLAATFIFYGGKCAYKYGV